KFVTRAGTNDFHGGLYEYFRNPWLNSGYWFDNRNLTPVDHATGKTCVDGTTTPITNAATQELYNPDNCHAPRNQVKLNQFGFRFGGPILIHKLFNGRQQA